MTDITALQFVGPSVQILYWTTNILFSSFHTFNPCHPHASFPLINPLFLWRFWNPFIWDSILLHNQSINQVYCLYMGYGSQIAWYITSKWTEIHCSTIFSTDLLIVSMKKTSTKKKMVSKWFPSFMTSLAGQTKINVSFHFSFEKRPKRSLKNIAWKTRVFLHIS